MKKILSSLSMIAAAAILAVSCEMVTEPVLDSGEKVTLKFSSEKPAFSDETKTEWTGETIQWSAGDKISIAYTVDGKWQNASGNASGDAKLYKSEALTAAAPTAQFNVSTYFKGTTEGSHLFYGVYPAPEPTGFPDAPVVILTIPANQNPSAESFDASGDLMIGVSGEYPSLPKDKTISLMWERLVAHAVITLKDINGLTAEETFKYITLTAQADANLVGQQKVNVVDKSIEKDNDAANVLKIAADKLSVSDRTVTFWACFLPETITSLTVEVETDKATYTREITGISKEFKKNARNTLAVKMNEAVRVEKAVDNNVTDVLTRTTTGVSGQNYTSWNDKKVTSTAVYAGQSAGNHESIQLRSDNNNSGVITTASGGYARKIVVKWNSNTSSGRTLNVYGNTSAYTSPTELYDQNKQGTLLGTIKCGTNTELEIEGDYEYIGMRSADGAMYLEEIQISWAPLKDYLIVSKSEIAVESDATSASFTVSSNLEWTATSDDADVSVDGNIVNVSFDANESTEEEKIYTVEVSAEGVDPQTVTITQGVYVNPEAGGNEVLAYTFDITRYTTTGYGVCKGIAADNDMTWTITCGQGGYLGINKASNDSKIVLGNDYLKVGVPLGLNADTKAVVAVMSDKAMAGIKKVEIVANSVTGVSGTAPSTVSLVYSTDNNTYYLVETQKFDKTNGNIFEFSSITSGYYAIVYNSAAWFRLAGSTIKYYK